MTLITIFAFLDNLGGPEILLILLFVLIFFGAKKIPELARGLGRGIKEFQSATKGIKDEIQESVQEDKSTSKSPTKHITDTESTQPEKG